MQLKAKQVVLDMERQAELEAIAKKQGVSVSALIRWAIEQYLFLHIDTVNKTEKQSIEQQAA